jgi:hypothetical protein
LLPPSGACSSLLKLVDPFGGLQQLVEACHSLLKLAAASVSKKKNVRQFFVFFFGFIMILFL